MEDRLAISSHNEFIGHRFFVAMRGGEVLGYIKGNLYDDFANWFKAAARGIRILSIGTKLPKGGDR
jgi:hypothetical protein